jgi:hypothetical protein
MMEGSRPPVPRHRSEEVQTSPGRGRYVYCVVEAEEPFDLGPMGIGDDDSLVYTVHEAGLAAVVSETPLRRYDPTRENLLAHEIVNETVMREHTMIPMSFGTIFRSDDDVTAMLRSTAPELTEVLAALRGKVELGLKVYWDREKAISELENERPAIHALKEEIATEANGSTYFARVQLGRLVEEALEERANALMWSVYEPLRPLSVASRTSNPIGDDMILNVAFLVERVREDEFDQAVKRLTTRYEDLLTFKYTGPWPPYRFVNIRLEVEGSD